MQTLTRLYTAMVIHALALRPSTHQNHTEGFLHTLCPLQTFDSVGLGLEAAFLVISSDAKLLASRDLVILEELGMTSES